MSCQIESAQNRNVRFKRNIRNRSSSLLPFVRWLLNYSQIDVIADFITGLTIGLIIIPQSVAYVVAVGLSAKIGLMSSVVGGAIYTILGTVKEISVGPTATMSLLTTQYISDLSIEDVGLLSLGCALVGIILSILRLGLVVEFISIPVSSAFGTAVAMTILITEMKNFLGLNFKSTNFFDSLSNLRIHLKDARMGDTSLGIICIVLLVLLDKLQDLPIKKTWKYRNVIKKSLWLIAMSKNAITILLACMLTRYFEKYHETVPFLLSDPVTPGLPELRSPFFETRRGNTTITVIDKIRTLSPGMIIIPVVALLAHISIGKYFDANATFGISHELLSLSLSNLICAFFNSSPVAGAFTRSAVSATCKVRTPISSFYATIMAFLALTYLTPYFRLIPKASLSAVIIAAVVIIIDYKILIPLWKNSKKDLLILIITLAAGLYLGIEIGLIIGVITNLSFLVYAWARPTIAIEKVKCDYGDYVMVTPDLGLFYPAVSYFEAHLARNLKKAPFQNLPIAVNCYFFKGLDYTAVKGLTRVIHMYNKQKRRIVFYNVNEKIYNMCEDIDSSVTTHFCDNDENYKSMLFEEKSDLRDTKESKILADDTKEMNGDCSKDLGEIPIKEEIPLLNIIKKQNRPNSL